MLKVLLVDDEPFILQGLKLLVDWEKEGFRIAGTAANGMEALAFLKKEKVDLVIADIIMPQMTGLELLEHIRKEKISDAYFVILSGYAEFSFAQQAMQNDCTDYLLKPVDSEILCKVLNKVLALRNREELDHEKNRKLEQAYLARHMIALIQGKFDDLNVRYIHEHMRCGTGVRYVEIQTEGSYDDEGTTDREMRTLQRRLYEYSREFLKEDADLSVFDVSVNEKIYDIGLILFDYVPEKKWDGCKTVSGTIPGISRIKFTDKCGDAGRKKSAGYQQHSKVLRQYLYASFFSGVPDKEGYLFL